VPWFLNVQLGPIGFFFFTLGSALEISPSKIIINIRSRYARFYLRLLSKLTLWVQQNAMLALLTVVWENTDVIRYVEPAIDRLIVYAFFRHYYHKMMQSMVSNLVNLRPLPTVTAQKVDG
jgi:hypothetical protein